MRRRAPGMRISSASGGCGAPRKLKRRYDVVIIGGGSHGLATTYYLAKEHGITDVAVLEKSYIGSGAAGRNDDHPRELPDARGRGLLLGEREALREARCRARLQPLFSQQGLTLAHSDRGIITANERAEVNGLLGIDSRVIYPDEIRKLCPEMNLSEDVAWPVMAALYHPPGGDHPPRQSSGATPAAPTATAPRSILTRR